MKTSASILVVDDEPVIRDTLAEFLQQEGFAVASCGTGEEAIRYGWNYARLLADGPSRAALVPSPVLTGMATGRLVRLEELTRIPSEVKSTWSEAGVNVTQATKPT